jgi:hypothetical protein
VLWAGAVLGAVPGVDMAAGLPGGGVVAVAGLFIVLGAVITAGGVVGAGVLAAPWA